MEHDKKMDKNRKPILVGQFHSLVEFDRAKALLTSAGLHPSSDNEYTIQTRPYLSAALGGARLFVLPNEAERARNLLKKKKPDVTETNYTLRARRAILAGSLAIAAGFIIGLIVGRSQNNIETGVSIGFIATLIWYMFFSHVLIPKAELKTNESSNNRLHPTRRS